jgi:hypothetical protein
VSHVSIEDYDALGRRIRELLERAAELRRPCKACSAELFFVRHANGKLTPYTSDGVNHFANCPEAARFKQPKGAIE